MFVKCFVVEINSSLEAMYEELADGGFDYETKKFGDGYLEIIFEEWSCRRIQEAMEIMKWYV